MFKNLFATVFAFFAKEAHDVEAILANFTGTVTKLEDAAAAKFAEAEDHALMAVHYAEMSEIASDFEAEVKAKAQEAAEVAHKIKTLLTV
jgi:hypothetical protein